MSDTEHPQPDESSGRFERLRARIAVQVSAEFGNLICGLVRSTAGSIDERGSAAATKTMEIAATVAIDVTAAEGSVAAIVQPREYVFESQAGRRNATEGISGSVPDLSIDDFISDAVISEIYTCYRGVVFNTARGIVRDTSIAADLTQETFVKVLRIRRDYDPDLSPLTTWLCVIARSLSKSYLRRRREILDADLAGFDTPDGDAHSEIERIPYVDAEGRSPYEAILDAILHKEQLEAVRACLADFSSREQSALSLWAEGVPLLEIAVRLDLDSNGCTEMAAILRARRYVFRTLEKLRQGVLAMGHEVEAGGS
jgi:RNA polymerase sigma factor (sigma-70 family)